MSLALEIVRDDDVMTCIGSKHTPISLEVDGENCIGNVEKSRKSLRNRPTINYRQFDDSSDEEFDTELVKHVIAVRPRNSPKKGVVRGCTECTHCQKVLARWRPENARRPVLDEAPTFYPNEEEFKDTLKYIESIRGKAEQYGICRIVPPSSWKPSCLLKEKANWENSKFSTRVQRVDLLQNRHSVRNRTRYHASTRKRLRVSETSAKSVINNENCISTGNCSQPKNLGNFGFEPGPDFTLESFQKYAEYFKQQYFRTKDEAYGCDQDHHQRDWEPTEEDIEGEYWRIIEKPTEEIEVLYGADLETGKFGSGFRKKTSCSQNSDDEYVKSGWNLNNFPRLTGSLLAFESEDISGILVPWLYIGMCFSSFCWHVEDHHFYSLNYMHMGAPKMWYGVSGINAPQLEAAMKKHLPDLFKEQPDILHKLVTQFSPFILKEEGIPVYRCVQHSGEFVLTFPRAYHSGFNCGFNCAEAVNVAPIDWLPHGHNAVELYREQCHKISVSHDKLLLGAAREAVRAQWDIMFLKKATPESLLWKSVCGQDKILGKTLKERVEIERVRREQFSSLQSRKMDANFDTHGDRECFLCHYDLHLSAAGCPCSSDKFACLNHINEICSCDWSMRFLLFRYEISELNILVEALGGKLSAVHKWGISDLGLSLRSYVAKRKSQVQESANQEASSLLKQGGHLVEKLSSTSSFVEGSRKGKQQKTVDNNESNKPTVNIHENSVENFQLPNKCSTSVVGPPVVEQQRLKEEDSYTVTQKDPSKEAYSGDKFMTVNTSISSDTTVNLLTNKNHNAICLKECKDHFPSSFDKTKVPPGKELEVLAKGHGEKSIPCNQKDQVVAVCETSVSVMGESDADTVKVMVESDHLNSHPDIKEEGKCRIFKEHIFAPSATRFQASHNTEIIKPIANFIPLYLTSKADTVKVMVESDHLNSHPDIKEGGKCRIFKEHIFAPSATRFQASHNTEIKKPIANFIPEYLASKQLNKHQNHNSSIRPYISDNGNAKGENACKGENSELDTFGTIIDKQQTSIGGQSRLPFIMDRNSLQKGPRIAKVVKRMACTAEALEFGMVRSGKLWSTSQAIFPKGYKSRVKYLNVLDPTQMCYYVSEIIDGGVHGPLFMVQVEQCPSEVFIHVSPTKCWDMVRERINHEIRRLRSLGKLAVPNLQPPGSIDGLEMFGLTSPAIIQEIEAIDHIHVSSEYWSSRQTNKKPPIVGEHSMTRVIEGPNIQNTSFPPGSDTLLQGLLKKANFEELQLLRRLFTDENLSTNREITQVLNKLIDKHSICVHDIA